MTPQLDFTKLGGLVPCVVQDANTEKVLMVAFMNEDAYQKTMTEKRATFYSRSRQRLWTKGETSGNYLAVVDSVADCDGDTLLLKVKPQGPVCHTGADTCFKETNNPQGLGFLEEIIRQRKSTPKEGSYTNKLLNAGINGIAQKVGEEAVELVIEAKDDHREKFLGEAADLFYHVLVLLAAKGVKLNEVVGVLQSRHKGQERPRSGS